MRDPWKPTVELVLAEINEMGPVSAAQIAAGTGLSERAVRRALWAAQERGLVECDNYQRRGMVWLRAETDRGGGD